MQAAIKLFFAAMGLLLMVCCPAGAYGDQAAIFAKVRQYSASVAQFENGKSNMTLGELYTQGRAVGKELAAELESLSDGDYALAQKEMKGFFVFREEVVGVEPMMVYFQKLAQRKGSTEDVDFFNFMVEVYGAGTWPAFTEQQTDYSGCAKYGDGTRTRIYLDAVKIRTPVNETYRTELNALIAGLRESFVRDGTCACGGPDAVSKELELFVEKAPHANFVGEVENLLAKVRAGKSKMRFSCVSG